MIIILLPPPRQWSQITYNSVSYGPEIGLYGKKIFYIGEQTGIDVAILQRLTECGAEIVQYKPSSIDKIEADIKWMVAECGKIDGLVFGIVHSDFRPLQFVKSEVVNQIMTDNYGMFVEVMRCLKKSRGLNDGASIVAMSSISSSRAMKAKMAFCASKAALDAAIRCLAVELADRGVRVNSIQKGSVDVDVEKSHIQDVMAVRSDTATQDNTAPLGIVKANEIAQMVAFLLSDAVKTITGTSIVIDGGYLA